MLIELSGIDGSGKTTIQKHIRRYLVDRRLNTWERSFRSSARLMFADMAAEQGQPHWSRVFSVEEVEMAHAVEMLGIVGTHLSQIDLARNSVVTDTYISRWLATAAMWGASNVDALVKVLSRLPLPMLSIHLTLDPLLAYDRLHSRVEGDSVLKMGSPDKVIRYKDAFDEILPALPYQTHIVDSGRSVDLVLSEVLGLLDQTLSREQNIAAATSV